MMMKADKSTLSSSSRRRLQLVSMMLYLCLCLLFVFPTTTNGQRTIANFGTRIKKRFGASSSSQGDGRGSKYILSQEGEDNNSNNNTSSLSSFLSIIKDTTQERPGMLATVILLIVGYMYLMYYQRQNITTLERKLNKQYNRQDTAPGEFLSVEETLFFFFWKSTISSILTFCRRHILLLKAVNALLPANTNPKTSILYVFSKSFSHSLSFLNSLLNLFFFFKNRYCRRG